MTEQINPFEFVAIKLELEVEDEITGETDFDYEPYQTDNPKARLFLPEPEESAKSGSYEMASMAWNDSGITNASSLLTSPFKQTNNISSMQSFSNICLKQCTESDYKYEAADNTTVFDEFKISNQEDPEPEPRDVESVTTKILPSKKLLYKCPVCSKYYPNGRLSIHMRVHTKKKLVHTVKRLVRTKEISYKCDACNKTFTRKAGLEVHQRIHNGEKPYVCDVCKKSFRQMSALSVHQSSHSGEKPFECDVCKHQFSRKDYLTIHQRIHTGEKPYICNVCKMSFRTTSQLSIHKRKPCQGKTF
ncbi:zinc finger protein 32-like [Artemia franciscana]|uniref:zinc finger protein 32-like n=1 Tax=Artemia franciscana TaxID=6661 RepID=UPI0032DB548E